MNVLNVAFPFAPVREDTAGGAEQVLGMLDRALCRGGHRSLVIACEGSQVRGELLAMPQARTLDADTQFRIRQGYRETLERAIEEYKPDLVHLHGLDFLEYLPSPGVPVVATLHLPIAWYGAEVFAMRRPNTWLHCVSRSQEENCPRMSNLLPAIANGVPEDPPEYGVRKRRLAVALGRICPEKGFHLAFEAAEMAGMPLLLAGQVYGYEDHQRYFRHQIVPRCGRRQRFIGTVGRRRKRRLLTAARCLLAPSLAPETSSLVAMEAAMCGTPSVVFRAGALAEIVEDGVTGFVVDSVEDMAAAIGECGRVDPARCRETALARFSETRAAAEYLRMYERLIGR